MGHGRIFYCYQIKTSDESDRILFWQAGLFKSFILMAALTL